MSNLQGSDDIQPSSTRSSATLADATVSPSKIVNNNPLASTSNSGNAHRMPEAEKPRQYMSAPDDTNADREGEEAEREFAEFGGDVPFDMVKVRGSTARVRSRSTTAGVTRMPSLHHVDSAFSEAHREMSRVASRAVTKENAGGAGAQPPAKDPNKVEWNENDPENPQNWTVTRKWAITALCSLLTVNVTFASSAPSSATRAIAAQFGCSDEVAVLTTSLFLCGYCLGPLLWAPTSELIGRRPVFVVTMLVYTLFQLPCALAPNITCLLIGRFIGGTFAAAPLTNAGGVIADIWDPVGRGPAMSVFSASVFLGPVMGPIVGGFVTTSYLGWRWVFWVMMIFAGACWVPVATLLPETYAPKLLAQRAKRMRKTEPEKNADKYADLEKADFSLKSIVTRTLARPFVMLFTEPILLLVTIYLSVIYGLLYALFSVFPIIWGRLRGFNNGEVGLMFIGVGIGTTLGALINIWVQRHYKVLVPKWHGHPPPEERLWGAMLAGPPLLIGIFLLGWTGNYASIHWMVPEVGALFLGVSFTLVFISFLSYLIETYLMFSASALAANTIVRSAVGAAFPLFTTQMFDRLGVNYACTLIGGIAILIFPSPYLFYKYGSRIRDGSKFAPCLDIHMKERVDREEQEEKEKMNGGHGV